MLIQESTSSPTVPPPKALKSQVDKINLDEGEQPKAIFTYAVSDKGVTTTPIKTKVSF